MITIQAAESEDDPGGLANALLRATHSGGVGVFVWDVANERLLWNRTMYQVYGLDPASFEHSGEAWLAALHPDDREHVLSDITAAMQGVRPYDTLFRIHGQHGEWRYIRAHAWVERDEQGVPLRMAGTNQDVTNSHRFDTLVETVQQGCSAQVGQAYFQALVTALVRALEVRYAAVIEVSPQANAGRGCYVAADGLPDAMSTDFTLAGTPAEQVVADGLCVFGTDLISRFDGYPLREALNGQCYIGVRLNGADGAVLGVLEVMSDRPVADLELARKLLKLFAGRTGSELERLLHEGEVYRLNAELEARVAARTADLNRTMRELEAFTYSVSHDLGAPLRAVLGFATALREDYGDQLEVTGRDYLGRTVAAAERMGRLLDDLVSLSKISLRPLNVGKTDLTALAQSIIADLQTQKPRPAMRFTARPHMIVHADPGLMRIVLDCLLRNAWKFTEMTRDPSIELVELQVDGRREIAVRDNGVGFDAATAARLFAPFQTFHANERGFSGGGTGLAIAQRVVHRHHGSIRAESQAGQGATFAFWLPPAAELMAMLGQEAS